MFTLIMLRPENKEDNDWVETELMRHESYDVIMFHWEEAVKFHLAANHPDPRAEIWFYGPNSDLLEANQYHWAWTFDYAYDENDDMLDYLEQRVIATGYKNMEMPNGEYKRLYTRWSTTEEFVKKIYETFVKTGISIET